MLEGFHSTVNLQDKSIRLNEKDLSSIYTSIFSKAENEADPIIVIAVSGNMTSRGVNCKTTHHSYPLTDMYYESSALSSKKSIHHFESIIQDIGRLCSRDKYLITRTLYVRNIKVPTDDYFHVQNALRLYALYYQMFDYHYRTRDICFTAMSLTDLLHHYSTHIWMNGSHEEQATLAWYHQEYNSLNGNISRPGVIKDCKRRLDVSCEEEARKRQCIQQQSTQQTQNPTFTLPSADLQEAFERDLRMLAHEANEPIFFNQQDPLEAALSQFETSIGRNDATWKTLAKHLIIRQNDIYVVKDLNEWTEFDMQKSLISFEQSFKKLATFQAHTSTAGGSWRNFSNGQIIKIRNYTQFKLVWH